MSDTTKVNELSDKLLEAMSIISESKLYQVQYDKTISCTITNDTKKKEGQYEVSDGSTKFYAYSSNENYRVNDIVYVTIPQGNYDNEKIIIGKKTEENSKPISFQQPFNTIFDMTGNILPKEQIIKGGLLANDVSYAVDSESGEITITDSNIAAGGTTKHLITLTDLSLANYTRLGLKADFKSWIPSAAAGNYGLKMVITSESPDIVADNGSVQQTQLNEYKLLFDNSNMYGNSYNYETNYTQEIVFDIDKEKIKGTIIKIDLEFYQLGNFLDLKGESIQSLSNNERLSENLFVENIYLCLGYDMDMFSGDYVEIFTKDPSTYVLSTNETVNNTNEKNKKIVEVRWIHIGEDGTPIDMIKKIENKEISKDYKIFWYRYRIGAAAADDYCGVYWDKVTNTSGLKYEFSPDVNKQQEKIKAIIIYDNSEIYRSNELVFTNQKTVPLDKEASHIMNALQIYTVDGTNGNYLIYGQNNSIKDSAEGDKIRTLGAKFDANGDGVHESEILSEKLTWTFPTNNTMIELIGELFYDKIALLKYDYKNYWINGEAGKEQAPEIFNPNLTYYTALDSDTFIEVENEFYTPGRYYIKNYETPITYRQGENYYKLEDGKYILTNEATVSNFSQFYILSYVLSNDTFDQDKEYYKQTVSKDKVVGQPSYKIAKYYSPSKSNNTIVCEYNLNGVIYKSEIELTFGKAGTMGTDQTLVIDFVGDINAISVDDPNKEVYPVTVRVYDKENKELTDALSNVEWSWYYNSTDKIAIKDSNLKTCKLEISKNKMPKHGELYIIQVKVGSLKTYFPIALKNSSVSYIEGPSEVIYMSDGTIDYYNVPYKAIGIDGLSIDCNWSVLGTNYKQFQLTGDYIRRKDLTATTYIENKYYTKNNSTYTIASGEFNSKNTYYECIISKDIIYTLSNNKYVALGNGNLIINNTYYLSDINYIDSLDNNTNRLKPLGIYVKDAPVYGVEAYAAGISYWTQPILVLQNNWPSSVLNAWDGKTLEINTDEGYILANAISAGKKNSSDNTFSGVMLGDWSDGSLDTEGSISKQTGVYGFHHGAMSYAFREDGTAFIGKDGKGRIILDGNKGIIQSASWNNNTYPKMQIDLDDTKIEMYGSSSDYIKLDATNTKYPIELGGSLRVNLSNDQVGYIGGLTANQGGVPKEEQAQGFGLRLLKGTSTEIGGFKATSFNTGMYYVGGGYLSISDGSLSMGSEDLNLYASNSAGATASKISLDATHVGMWVNGTGFITFGQDEDGKNKDQFLMKMDDSKIVADNTHIGMWVSGMGHFSLEKNTSNGMNIYITADNPNSSWLECNIPANRQSGIYARFA